MKGHLQLIPTADMTRDQWLLYRHSGLGASEVGTVLGLNDYTSSLELFYYKIGDAPKFDTEQMASFMGLQLEDKIAELWQYWDGDEDSMIMNFQAKRVVRKCRRVNAFVRNPAFPWLYVSLDRVINKHAGREEGTLELKTISGFEADKWEAGLPPKYVTQVNTQEGVCEFDYGEMGVLQDGRRMSVLPFDFSPSIFEHIVVRTKRFWDSVVAARKLVNEKYHVMATNKYNQRRLDELNAEIDTLAPEPDGTLVYTEYLSQRFRNPSQPDRRGTLQEEEIARKHLEVSAKVKEWEEEKQLLENLLKRALADHQVLDFGAAGKVTWTITGRGRLFRNKLRA